MSDDKIQPFKPPHNNLPIIGVHCHPLGIAVQVPMECRCATPATPLFMVSLTHVIQCPKCKANYRIGKVAFEIATGNCEVHIARVVEQAAPGVN